MATSLLLCIIISVLTCLIHRSVSLKIQNRQPTIKAVDPFDHTWIERWAALGDSFGVGLGAGHAIKPSNNVELNPGGFFKGYCYQYSEGYPNVINSDSNLGVQPHRHFQYLGCSGATASNVLADQVPLLKSPQMVTLSIGGNDADFASILNYCVYQWMNLPWYSCDQVLHDTQNKINSPAFTTDLTNLIGAIKGKLSDPSNRIYWVGYGKFFDVTTTDCDKVSWDIGQKAFTDTALTQARRQSMNDMVDLVNTKIKAVIDAAGPQVVYVDWQADAQTITGRYCEPGVDESWHRISGGVSQDREQTVFYEWGTTKDDDTPEDKGHDELRKRQESFLSPNTTAGNLTFEGRIANYVIEGSISNPTAYNNSQQDFGFQITGSFLPDRYGRTFHPTKYGNSIIAKNVINAITQEQAKLMNQPAVTTTVNCNAAGATVGPAAASGAPSPSATKQCHGVSGNMWVISRDVAAQNVQDFCKETSGSVEYNQNTTNYLRLSLQNSISPNASTSTAPDCDGTFISQIIDGCDGDPVNNPNDYKFGGVYATSDGWTYAMVALAKQTDEDSCDVSYDVFFDTFEVRGKNFPNAKLGQDGSGLLAQLRGCGAVTDWSFQLTPNDVKYQWYANGRLPIGTKACVGRAVRTAGGTSVANCEGAG